MYRLVSDRSCINHLGRNFFQATQVDNADRYALATLSAARAAHAAGGVRFARRRLQCRVSEAAAPGALLATLHTDPPAHNVRT